jgi:hypothetical protein
MIFSHQLTRELITLTLSARSRAFLLTARQIISLHVTIRIDHLILLHLELPKTAKYRSGKVKSMSLNFSLVET